MGLMLDSNVVIQGEKGLLDLSAWLMDHADEQAFLAAISVAELWHGILRAPMIYRARRRRFIKAILTQLPVLPYTERTGMLHAKLWAYSQSKGLMPGYYDLIVAATALEHRLTLVTFNAKHFQSVPGLKLLVP